MALQPVRHRFTVDEYHRMGQAGIFGEDDRVELIDGEIVEMTPIGSRHAACVDRLTRIFVQHLGPRAIVRVQGPIRLGEHSEPQPDLALLRPRGDFYAEAHPEAGDVLLVVEVAETSGPIDRGVKLPLYARAGIPEVWLVDLAGGAIEVHRQPSPRGYQDVQRVGRGQSLSSQAVPGLTLAVEDILGPGG